MSDTVRDYTKIPVAEEKPLENSKEKASISPANEMPGTSLDPRIARRVAASLVKHREALEYLKNH